MIAALCLAALAAALSPDPDPPTARIDFPLPSALTDAATIRVRGSASDPDGVAAVRVNGVPASTVDGFGTWWAVVPLELGENELFVEAVDVLGHLDPLAASTVVRRDGAIVTNPRSATHDSAGRRTWISDSDRIPGTFEYRTRVLAVNSERDHVSVVSSRAVGTGPLPEWSTKIRFDPHSGGALCIHHELDALLHIDLTNGDRTVISGAGVGFGTPFVDPLDFAVDPESPRAWVVQMGSFQGNGAVLEVDLLTGQRKLVSTYNLGSGPWPTAPVGIAVAPGNKRAVVQFTEDFWNPGNLPLIAVDLAKGHRAWITDGPVPPLRPWKTPKSLAVPSGALAFVGDAWFQQGGVFAVDLASGVARKVSDAEHPAGPLTEVVDLAWNASTQRLTTVDSYRASILAMDPSDGSFELLHRNEMGDGPVLSKSIYGIAIDLREPTRAIVLDVQSDDVLEVSLLDGSRKLLSGAGKGLGPMWSNPWQMAADLGSTVRRCFVLALGPPRIYSVDLDTGDRELISSPNIGTGPLFEYPWRMEFDPASGMMFVLDTIGFFIWEQRHRIVKVDPRTGDRTLVSDPDHGVGPAIISSKGMAFDGDGRLWVDSNGALLEVDVRSGNRRVVSGHGVGAGPDVPIGGPMAWDTVHRRIVMLGAGGMAGQILSVDPTSGNRTSLAVLSEGVGPGLPFPVDIALAHTSPTGDPVLVLPDMGLSAILALDLFGDPLEFRNPGWRTIVSR